MQTLTTYSPLAHIGGWAGFFLVKYAHHALVARGTRRTAHGHQICEGVNDVMRDHARTLCSHQTKIFYIVDRWCMCRRVPTRLFLKMSKLKMLIPKHFLIHHFKTPPSFIVQHTRYLAHHIGQHIKLQKCNHCVGTASIHRAHVILADNRRQTAQF